VVVEAGVATGIHDEQGRRKLRATTEPDGLSGLALEALWAM
jgi:hypothetical protein